MLDLGLTGFLVIDFTSFKAMWVYFNSTVFIRANYELKLYSWDL